MTRNPRHLDRLRAARVRRGTHGILLYYSFIGGLGLAVVGTAPDVAWFAYAPLTEKAFSPGHTVDY